MHYLKFGESKKFIVFLHGWGADHRSFLIAKDYFADYCKVFVDFEGFGNSKEPSHALFVSDYAQQLFDLLGGFEIEELILVGHSFGGRVAVKFAFFYQHEFAKLKLCLVDAAGIRPKLSVLKKFKIWKYKWLKRKAEKNEKLKSKLNRYGSSDYKKLSKVMKQTFVNVVNEDLTACASKILCDTQIIWGENDRETKLFMAKRYRKLIKGAKLEIIEGAGHFCFLEKPQEFLIILDTFVKN